MEDGHGDSAMFVEVLISGWGFVQIDDPHDLIFMQILNSLLVLIVIVT